MKPPQESPVQAPGPLPNPRTQGAVPSHLRGSSLGPPGCDSEQAWLPQEPSVSAHVSLRRGCRQKGAEAGGPRGAYPFRGTRRTGPRRAAACSQPPRAPALQPLKPPPSSSWGEAGASATSPSASWGWKRPGRWLLLLTRSPSWSAVRGRQGRVWALGWARQGEALQTEPGEHLGPSPPGGQPRPQLPGSTPSAGASAQGSFRGMGSSWGMQTGAKGYVSVEGSRWGQPLCQWGHVCVVSSCVGHMCHCVM